MSYDIGWQKCSTGRLYHLFSGHGFMIGCLSGKVVSSAVKSNKFVKCSSANRRNLNVKPHSCSVDHIGLSGSMEAIVALELTEEVF